MFLDRVDDEKNVRRITLTIKSLPAPNKIQWNAKNKDDDTFTPININSKEYKGTTVSFPHPLLVVRQSDQLEKTSYKIEVINFIGKTVQSIPGKKQFFVLLKVIYIKMSKIPNLLFVLQRSIEYVCEKFELTFVWGFFFSVIIENF